MIGVVCITSTTLPIYKLSSEKLGKVPVSYINIYKLVYNCKKGFENIINVKFIDIDNIRKIYIE